MVNAGENGSAGGTEAFQKHICPIEKPVRISPGDNCCVCHIQCVPVCTHGGVDLQNQITWQSTGGRPPQEQGILRQAFGGKLLLDQPGSPEQITRGFGFAYHKNPAYIVQGKTAG